jgi:hypothetical protein
MKQDASLHKATKQRALYKIRAIAARGNYDKATEDANGMRAGRAAMKETCCWHST